MADQALRAALLKLQAKSPLAPASSPLHSGWPWINSPGKQVP